ncbi:MAG: hypothetical protein IT289_08000 [Oligoflexia bacterium]|nr:hypothetical protein [Oligoflexia bacterium]
MKTLLVIISIIGTPWVTNAYDQDGINSRIQEIDRFQSAQEAQIDMVERSGGEIRKLRPGSTGPFAPHALDFGDVPNVTPEEVAATDDRGQTNGWADPAAIARDEAWQAQRDERIRNQFYDVLEQDVHARIQKENPRLPLRPAIADRLKAQAYQRSLVR